MKYIKTYEDTTFKIGDIVKCVDEVSTNLIKNKCYTISNIKTTTSNILYELEEWKPSMKYFKDRFTTPTPKEVKQYKLEKNRNKYNL